MRRHPLRPGESMEVASVESFLVDVPQKWPIAPYQSRYKAMSSTLSLLLRLETDTGVVGWGECPQIYLGDGFTGAEAVGLRSKLVGLDPTAIAALYCDLGLDGTYLQSAVEMALWDILGKACGQPLYRLLGGPYRKSIDLAACMGIKPYAEAGRLAEYYVELGFRTLKTKAGRRPEEDLEMVRGIRDAVGDRLALRIDPNTGYSPDVCLQLAKDLERYNLQYFEQPMPADRLDDSARIRKLTKTPLALNESVTTMSVVRSILEKEAADVILPDTYQCGGIWAVKLIADVAASAGVPCVMHCAHDLGPKTAAMLHLSACTPNFSLANDCTYYGLVDDVIAEPFKVTNATMTVPESPGLGLEVSLAKVRQFQIAASA
jgi:L-alanine-DL-glutamate epimerase-like enolase superfamily enzyme